MSRVIERAPARDREQRHWWDRAYGAFEERLSTIPLSDRIGTRALAVLVVASLLVDLVACALWAPTLVPFVLVGAVLWWFGTGTNGTLGTTASGLAMPLLIGLTLIAFALAVLQAISGLTDPNDVTWAEFHLAELRLTVEGWRGWSVGVWLAVGTALIVAAVLLTKLDVVAKFIRVHQLFGFAQAVLLVLTSFVIYAQAPLQRELRITHHALVVEYRAALEHELKSNAQQAAAASVKRSFKHSRNSARTAQLAAILVTIDHATDKEVLALEPRFVLNPPDDSGVEQITEKQAFAPPVPPGLDAAGSAEESEFVDPFPATSEQLDQEQDAVEQRQSSGKRAAAQALTAVFLVAEEIADGVIGAQLGGVDPSFLHEEALSAATSLIDGVADQIQAKILNIFRAKDRATDHPATVTLSPQDLPAAAAPPDLGGAATRATQIVSSRPFREAVGALYPAPDRRLIQQIIDDRSNPEGPEEG